MANPGDNWRLQLNTEDNWRLHLLADVAIADHVQRRQQGANLTTQQGQQQAGSTAPLGQAPVNPNQGVAAANSTATPGEFTPTDPYPLSYNLLASTSQGSQVATGPQRSKGRPTGFNKETGENRLTPVCGRVTPSKGTPGQARVKPSSKYYCPRCRSGFTRPRNVKDHFPGCVNKWGNPAGMCWWDHESCEGSRTWHHRSMPAVEEEEDEEEDNEEEEGDRDDEEKDDDDDDEEDEEGDEERDDEEDDDDDDDDDDEGDNEEEEDE